MALSANDTTALPNTFFDRVQRMFWSEGYQEPEYAGILSVILPLIVLVIGFFIIKKYSKKTNILKWYAIIGTIIYAIYFVFISKQFYVV